MSDRWRNDPHWKWSGREMDDDEIRVLADAGIPSNEFCATRLHGSDNCYYYVVARSAPVFVLCVYNMGHEDTENRRGLFPCSVTMWPGREMPEAGARLLKYENARGRVRYLCTDCGNVGLTPGDLAHPPSCQMSMFQLRLLLNGNAWNVNGGVTNASDWGEETK